MIGGYLIIDFQGLDTSKSLTIKGIYDKINKNYRKKPILCKNISEREVGAGFIAFSKDPQSSIPNELVGVIGQETGDGYNAKEIHIQTNDTVILTLY